MAGRTAESARRGYHRGIRLLLVGQTIQRAGDLHGRRNTRNLWERLTQLTTNKVSIPERKLLDRNFVFKNFATKFNGNTPTESIVIQKHFLTLHCHRIGGRHID